ncbi:MAG: hypothetical protein Kow0067_00660 [Coriobacteriia bacterium]
MPDGGGRRAPVAEQGAEASSAVGRVRRAAGIGLAAVILLAALSMVLLSRGEGVGDALASARWWGVAGALGLAGLSILAEGCVLASLHGELTPRSIARMVRAYLSGGFVGSVTPYAAGGAPAWTWALTREGIRVGEAAGLVAGRTMVTTAFLAAMAAVATIAAPGIAGAPKAIALSALFPLALLLALVIIARRPEAAGARVAGVLRWLGRRKGAERLANAADDAASEIEHFAGALRGLRKQPFALLGAFGALTAARFCQLLAIPLLLAALGRPLELGEALIGAIVVWVGAAITPAPSGEGVAQAVIVGVFGRLATPDAAAAAALAWRATVYYPIYLVGGLFFARLLRGLSPHQW